MEDFGEYDFLGSFFGGSFGGGSSASLGRLHCDVGGEFFFHGMGASSYSGPAEYPALVSNGLSSTTGSVRAVERGKPKEPEEVSPTPPIPRASSTALAPSDGTAYSVPPSVQAPLSEGNASTTVPPSQRSDSVATSSFDPYEEYAEYVMEDDSLRSVSEPLADSPEGAVKNATSTSSDAATHDNSPILHDDDVGIPSTESKNNSTSSTQGDGDNEPNEKSRPTENKSDSHSNATDHTNNEREGSRSLAATIRSDANENRSQPPQLDGLSEEFGVTEAATAAKELSDSDQADSGRTSPQLLSGLGFWDHMGSFLSVANAATEPLQLTPPAEQQPHPLPAPIAPAPPPLAGGEEAPPSPTPEQLLDVSVPVLADDNSCTSTSEGARSSLQVEVGTSLSADTRATPHHTDHARNIQYYTRTDFEVVAPVSRRGGGTDGPQQPQQRERDWVVHSDEKGLRQEDVLRLQEDSMLLNQDATGGAQPNLAAEPKRVHALFPSTDPASEVASLTTPPKSSPTTSAPVSPSNRRFLVNTGKQIPPDVVVVPTTSLQSESTTVQRLQQQWGPDRTKVLGPRAALVPSPPPGTGSHTATEARQVRRLLPSRTGEMDPIMVLQPSRLRRQSRNSLVSFVPYATHVAVFDAVESGDPEVHTPIMPALVPKGLGLARSRPAPGEADQLHAYFQNRVSHAPIRRRPIDFSVQPLSLMTVFEEARRKGWITGPLAEDAVSPPIYKPTGRVLPASLPAISTADEAMRELDSRWRSFTRDGAPAGPAPAIAPRRASWDAATRAVRVPSPPSPSSMHYRRTDHASDNQGESGIPTPPMLLSRSSNGGRLVIQGRAHLAQALAEAESNNNISGAPAGHGGTAGDGAHDHPSLQRLSRRYVPPLVDPYLDDEDSVTTDSTGSFDVPEKRKKRKKKGKKSSKKTHSSSGWGTSLP